MTSILTSVKKMLGISATDTSFDADIIMHINTVFTILNQLGVGPATGFSISDSTSVWTDFMPATSSIEAVKTYIYLKVRLLFDPPTSSAVKDAIDKSIAELEWRINVIAN